MNAFRAFSPCAVFLSCIFAALASVAQSSGQAASPPPVIQGPAGGPLALPPAPNGAGAGQEPLKFKMYALLGQKKANATAALDADLKPLESVLKSLPYTDYSRISIDERETPDGVDTQFPINPVYSLVAHPTGTDEQGAAKLDIHVDLMQDGKLIKALTAQATAKPGDALLLRGMPLPPGELVIVLQRDPGKQDSKDGKSDQDQDKKDQQEQQKPDQKSESKDKDSEKKQEQKKDEEKKDAKEDQADKKEDQEKADDDKKESKNLESILQSLEDVDRKEQSEVRNKRDRIDFKGDWW